MARRAWRLVNVRDVPGDMPPPDDGVTAEERETARAELRRDPAARVDVPGYAVPRSRWHAVRPFLGISAFGIAAAEADAGETLIWTHTEAPYGQEELYFVHEGRVRFHCDGEEVEAGPGDLLYLAPQVVRGALALETPTLLLLLGGRPGAYEPPIWSADWRPPDDWLASLRGA